MLLEMMLDGRFTWDTARQAAVAWGCDRATVRDYASESRRHYIREVERAGRDDYRARIMAGIEAVARASVERTEEVIDVHGRKHVVRKPDLRTARQALVDLAQLGGVLVHKHEVAVTEMTDEEIRAQLRAHGLEVRTLETTAELVLGQGETHGSDDDGEAGAPPTASG